MVASEVVFRSVAFCFMSSREVSRSGGRVGVEVDALGAFERRSTSLLRVMRSLVWL